MQQASTSVLIPGDTCWRRERADRAAFLVDTEAYFTAVFENGAANQGNVWIWAIPGQAPGLSAWPTFKHDSRRTGG